MTLLTQARSRRLALAAVAVFCALPASTAAAGSNGYIGAPSGVEPQHGTQQPGVAAPPAALSPALKPNITCPAKDASNNPTPSPLCNMTYHNGPVVLTNTTHIVYWQPSGYSVSANYHALTERYLGDVAADSGRVANPYNVDTQYTDSTNTHIAYSQTFGGALTDTTAFPAAKAGCTLQGTSTACLTETQEVNELDAFVKNNSLPRGTTNIYFLVLPEKVQTCFNDFSDCGPYGGVTDSMGNFSEYCAYHSSFDIGNGNTLWANMPDGADGGCNVINSPPNGDGADTLIDSLSHEHNETITNPEGNAWFDANGSGEDGDKCNFTFGPSLDFTATGGYDVLINHHPYEIQPEWDNSITGCSMTFGAVAPTSAFTFSPGAPIAAQVVSFDGTGSASNDAGGYIIKYTWDFGDGSGGSGATPTHSYATAGSYSAKLTVEDDAGMTATTTHTVNVLARPTTLAYTGASAGNFGDPVTLSATLTDTTTAGGVGGRTVSFALGTQSCSGITLSSGAASCSITLAQTPGAYTVSATFAGDSVYAASSTSHSFTINKAPTTTTVVSDHPTSVFGQPVTFTATVTPNDGGGTVSFSADGSTIAGCGARTLTASSPHTATCTTAALSVAGSPHAITAVYSGDTNYLGSTSATILQKVNKDPTTTTVTATPGSPSDFGTPVTFKAAVTANPPGAGTPTGSVAFKVDGTPVGTVGLGGGTASITTSSLSAGSHTIVADYSGDGSFLPSSGSLPYTVTCAVTITGARSGALEVTASTCIEAGAVVTGAVTVHGGGSLDIEGAAVNGSIDAAGTSGVIRICGSHVSGSVDIKGATGLVLVGDPGDAACAPNTIGGSLILKNNTGGVEAIGNTVSGPILIGPNSGPGPFPGDVTTISGNHH